MDSVLLKEMSKEDFDPYFQNKIKRYAGVLSENIIEQGEDPSSKALKQLNGLLPNGIETPNHHLFNIQRGENLIGFVWLKIEEEKKSAFLYEIYILEEYRGKGYGTETMKRLEEILVHREIEYFKLHVFGSNTGARKLYEELGFEIAGINMLKPLANKR